MLQPNKKIPTPDEILGEKKIPSPQDILGDSLKKKDGTKPELPSTTQKTSGASAQTDGSLDSTKERFKKSLKSGIAPIGEKPKIGSKESEKVLNTVLEREQRTGNFDELTKQKLANYRQSTKVLPQERTEILDELNAKKEKKGFLNGLQSGLKEGWNTFIDVIGVGGSEETKNTWKADLDPFADEKKEAVQFFAEKKIKPTKEQIEAKTDELFINKKLLAKKQEKINQYLGDLDTNSKIILKADAQERFTSIPKERTEISDRIAMNEKAFTQLLEESKQPMTPEDKVLVETELLKIGKYLDEDYKAVNKLTKNLGTAQDELDMFKRNYGAVENVANRIATSVADAGIGVVSGIDYITQYTNPIGAQARTIQVQEGVEKARESVQDMREQFRPDSEEITLDNFGQYAVDLLANQSGTLLAIGTTGGVGGASILGLGQAGQTYSEMYKENRKSAKYSPSQMAFAPLVSGVSTGVLSSLPTAQTLKNAGNVWKSMLKNEATKELTDQAIKNTSRNIYSQIGRDMSKEVSTELLDNTIQNAVKKDMLGEKNVGYFDNSWKVIKDTALLTGMLNAGALPQVTMSAVKMFTPSELNKVLDSNGAKIIELSKQLDNINLDDNAKKLVENQISELTKSSTKIIDNTIKKIDGLTEDEVKKVVQYESKKEKVANQAQEVKENPELNDQTKKVILEGLSNEYKNAVEKSNEIVNAEIQKPTIKEEQITQPQAEVQKTEQEALVAPVIDKPIIKTEKGNLLKFNNKRQSSSGNKDVFDYEILDDKNNNIGNIELIDLTSYDYFKEQGIDGFIVTNVKTKNRGEGIGRDAYKSLILNSEKRIFSDKTRSEDANKMWNSLVKDGFAEYNEKLDRYVSIKPINETQAQGDIATDGNIPIGISENADVAIDEKPTTEVTETEVVESAVEPIASKETPENVIVEGDDLILKHGTPHNFDKFQLEKIGSGEGNQAFGYGLYFTDGSKIAESYAKKLSEDKTGVVYTVRIKDGRKSNWADWRLPMEQEQEAEIYNSLSKEEKQKYIDFVDSAFEKGTDKDYTGSFDELGLDSDGFPRYEGSTGKQTAIGNIYQDLKDAFGQEKATEIFKRAGFDGIRYRAKRGYGEETNYVVFNPNSISIESKSSKGDSKVKKYKLSTNGQAFNVERKDGVLQVTNSQGKPVSKPTERAVLRKHADSIDFTQGKKASESEKFTPSEESISEQIIDLSENPAEIASEIEYLSYKDPREMSVAERKSYKEQIIADEMTAIKEEGFFEQNDINNLEDVEKTRKAYFSEDGRLIDELAQEMSEQAGITIEPSDIADFITKYPLGKKERLKTFKDEMSQEQIAKSNKVEDLKKKFTKITGLEAKKEFLLKALEQSNRKSVLNSVLDQMTDEELSELDKTINQIEQETYGKNEQAPKGDNQSKSDKISGEKSGIQKEPTRKESRKQAVSASIDEIANSAKALESIFGIKIKADFGDGKAQGTSRDQLIDFIATTAKAIANTGIEIDEAIRTVIAELRKSYDLDIEVDEIKKAITPETEEAPATFERKPGKKSLLTRAATGNDATIKKAISKYSLDYEVESQEVAKNNADAFVEEVGIQTALEAVRSGKIVGAEKAFVYAKIIDEITNNIAQYNEEEIAQLERLNVEILGEIAKEFDQESRNAGRFISALGAIYNGSLGRYNLSKQIADYKALNDGVIPDDILQKFKEADIRIKELEAKLAELQKEKDAQEAEQQFQNIVEAIARKNKLPRNRGISNTQKAKELADKLRSFKTTSKGSLSAATPMSLAYDGAIEVAATILENGGKLADAIKKGIDSIKGQKLDTTEEAQAMNDFIGAFDNLEPKGRNINIDETGKLKIPHSLIREHVENGIDNIDDLVKAISEDMKEILPEEKFTEREIRDAITQYGKISNPTKDDVETQIGIMKSLGRLISELEDAYSGKRPLRSGLQRRAMTLEERQMQRKLKELLRDLPMDDADLTRAWKTALDSIKSRLKNQIADLDKQIADGEKRKAERKTIEYDEEAKALRDIRDQKRDLLDELVGKPELSMEEKIEKATILTQNSIDSLQEMIVTGEIDYKTKPTPVTSAKLETLREQRRQLRKQLEEMRADAGLVEMKRLETAKKSRLNRIKELERRIKEKDFSVRTPKPLPIDAELLKIEEQLQEQKAIFEKEKHIFELKNRSKLRKLGTGIVNIIGITRLLKAGGEFSQVLVQQGFLTPEMLVRQPKEFFKAMYKLGKAFISPDSAKRYEAEMKSDPLYPLMQKTKLSLTGTDHRLDAQEENYQLDLITDTWNMIGEKLGDKKVRTIQGLIKSALGMTLTESDVKSIGQQFKESSPWKMFERGAVSYSNHIKMVKFAQGVKELQKQGKDPINDIEDYKKVAKYVNTFSGRANLGKAEMISKDAALLIFSLRNWYSQLQQLSPVFYSNLGDAKQWKNVKSLSDLKNIKPTVAQKMAVKSFMTSVIAITSFKVAFMAWANAMTDDDEEKWTLETDSRSSDFGKLRKGNKTFDLWHGLNGLLVFYSRLFTQETKSTKSEEIKPLGKGFGTPNSFELAVRYATNKLAPSAGYVARLAQTHEEIDPSTGEKYRVDPFGNVYGDKEMKDLFVPIYWSAINEIRKEDPDVYESFLASIGILGMSVGTDPKGEKFKDIIGEQGSSKRPSRPSAPKRPSRP